MADDPSPRTAEGRAGLRGEQGPQGKTGPQGERGPPGPIGDAWEDHRRQRALEDEERARQELATSSLAIDGEDVEDDGDAGRKKKKRKHRK
jgi:hypothetical protein